MCIWGLRPQSWKHQHCRIILNNLVLRRVWPAAVQRRISNRPELAGGLLPWGQVHSPIKIFQEYLLRTWRSLLFRFTSNLSQPGWDQTTSNRIGVPYLVFALVSGFHRFVWYSWALMTALHGYRRPYSQWLHTGEDSRNIRWGFSTVAQNTYVGLHYLVFTFIVEAVKAVDASTLVVASKQEHVFWILDF